MDCEAFVQESRACLISPAGYGKTYTIVECLKYTNGRQLILTHTHAGVASIKEKIREAQIDPGDYNVETISSFVQTYVQWFYAGSDFPDQSDSVKFHSFILEKAKLVFSNKIVSKIIIASYGGLFVDEYQDCTKQQHEIVSLLSQILPTRILGDPLQAIFDFNGDLVSFKTDLDGFKPFPELEVPFRWYKDGNNAWLGDRMIEFRKVLEARNTLSLQITRSNGLFIFQVQERDIFDPKSEYRKILSRLIVNSKNNKDLDSLLIIVPEYQEITENGLLLRKGGIYQRDKLRSIIDFTRSVVLLEAIDDSLFYSLAKKADKLVSSISKTKQPFKKIRREIFDPLFLATGLNFWMGEDRLKNKRGEENINKSKVLNTAVDLFISEPTLRHLHELLALLSKGFKLKNKRQEVFRSLMSAIRNAYLDDLSVEEAMRNNRNNLRRSGRKVVGKCLGTTLLTKGLEFDTVVILDAHRFSSPEHLYVALTRCCKQLIIFTEKLDLTPYQT